MTLPRGETVLVTTSSGGNPPAARGSSARLKFSANWELPVLSNSNLIVEYFRNRSDNVTAGVSAAHPGDRSGLSGPGDARSDRAADRDRPPPDHPRASSDGERLRWGLNLSGTVGKAAPGGGGGMMGGMRSGGGGPGGPPGAEDRVPDRWAASGWRRGAGRGPGGGGPMMAMFGGGGQGRWNLRPLSHLALQGAGAGHPGRPGARSARWRCAVGRRGRAALARTR